MEFENPVNVNQELVFMCYCHKDVKHACPLNKYNRDSFVKSINTAYTWAMKNANFTLDVHYPRNDVDIPIYLQVEDKKLIDKPYTVRFVDAGIIKTEDLDNGVAPAEKLLMLFNKIDDSPGADGNPRLCDLYWNNYEDLEDFGPWPQEIMADRHCCFRFK